MVARHLNCNSVRLLALTIALAATGCLVAPPMRAGELDKLDTSLKLIPADAAFYSSMLRNREQFDAVAGSNAWAKIKEMPAVQQALSMYSMQSGVPGSGPAQVEAALHNPEVRKIIDLVIDMASNEAFVYGDDNFIDFVELLQDGGDAMRYGPMVAQATGRYSGLTQDQLQTRILLTSLAKHVDLIGVPGIVFGFKLKNVDLGKEQLIKLEMLANVVLEMNAQTKGHFKKTKLGDYEYLVLNLDGSMLPWDKLPTDKLIDAEAVEGDAQKVIDRIKASKLVLALGLRGDYLLASIGPSLECLEKLGKGDRLADRPELKPLAKYAAQRLVSLGYLSAEMVEGLNNQKKGIDDLQDAAGKLLTRANLSDAQQSQIRADINALAKDVKAIIPKLGAIAGLSFLCDRGVEGYRYQWGSHDRLDGSKPLGLVEHVGGNPILGVVARQKVSLSDYDLMVKWAKKGYGYFETFGLPNMPENERAKAKQFLASALPLLSRADKANRDLLLPALADGQLALVFDDKLTSTHFIESAPATEKPMPMIEPAVVAGVSDARLLKQAFGEYRAVVNGLIDAVRQIEGSKIPECVGIPEPKVSEGSSGTIYSFTLPDAWGVDKQIVPNIGVSEHVAVFTASQQHTERLLKTTPLSVGGAWRRPIVRWPSPPGSTGQAWSKRLLPG